MIIDHTHRTMREALGCEDCAPAYGVAVELPTPATGLGVLGAALLGAGLFIGWIARGGCAVSRRISKAARRYLLTGQPPLFAVGFAHAGRYFGGRWAAELPDNALPTARPTIRHFATPGIRDAWVAKKPDERVPLGKRDPWVKAFRARSSR